MAVAASVVAAPLDASEPRLLDAFLQSSPATGAPPTRRTELRLWADERTLFVAIRAFDPEPGTIVARQRRRDVEAMLAEDQVTLVIDAEGAGRNAYLFAVNANGAQFDGLVYDGGQLRHDWDAIWDSEAAIGLDGWTAHLAIPLAVFGRGGAQWRINAERWMPRGNERVRLAGLGPDRDVHSLGGALPLPALRAEREGWGLRIKPSLRFATASEQASRTGHAEHRIEPGLELFHESRAGWRTTAAWNVDFGEAEADERSVNLSRFELFRPETREFFLRDAGRFSFGGLDGSAVMPYYSRRIGVDAEGRARGLDAGLKFAGTVGGVEVGAFGARVEGGPVAPGVPEQPAAEVAVLRVARPLGTHHRMGLIATAGNPQGTQGSHLGGVDYQFRDTGWGGSKTLEIHAWAMESVNAGAPDGSRRIGQAGGASLRYPNVGLTGEASVQRIGRGFDPALGYVAEDDVLRSQGSVGWWHRSAAGADLIPALDWDSRRTPGGAERTLLLNPEVHYASPAGDSLTLELLHEQDRLAQAFEPVPGVAVPAGDYRWRAFYGVLRSSPSRRLHAEAELRAGGYYDGRRQDQLLSLGWKPSASWGWNVGMARNAIRLPAGNFTVKVASLRLEHTPDTRTVRSALLQWDNVSKTLGASVRWRWMWKPGQELVFAADWLRHRRPEHDAGELRAILKAVWNFAR